MLRLPFNSEKLQYMHMVNVFRYIPIDKARSERILSNGQRESLGRAYVLYTFEY